MEVRLYLHQLVAASIKTEIPKRRDAQMNKIVTLALYEWTHACQKQKGIKLKMIQTCFLLEELDSEVSASTSKTNLLMQTTRGKEKEEIKRRRPP